MMASYKIKTLILIVSMLLSGQLLGQNVSVQLGKTKIGVNEEFQITATIENQSLRDYSKFPEIPGFQKRGTSSSTSTSIINGRVSSSHSITQSYRPTKQGKFVLKPFQMTINGVTKQVQGATVVVGAAVKRRSRDPFADLWGANRYKQREQEFIDVKEDAFFAITTDKKEVYVGEGFTLDIAFYIALKNRAKLDFYKIGEQLTEILKKVKPTNCWEENFGIESINGEYVTINGEQYRQFKVYEASYFPLNTDPIEIPSVGLEMIKYKVAKNPTFFGRNTQEDFKTFYSKARTVKVKDLPAHPLKDQVSIGNYKLVEKGTEVRQETGKSFVYNFKIQGEGNISAINEPSLKETGDFIFYSPSINQGVTRANGRVYGAKSFEYYIEPQEPGSYQFKDYMSWIYFNPKLEKYDTLYPKANFVVQGESKKNAVIAANDLGGFYDTIEHESNELQSTIGESWLTLVVNVVILLLLGTIAFFVTKKFN